MENFSGIITWLFVVANTGRVLAYLPQIFAAWKCQNGAASVSRLTWGYFAMAHMTGVLYAAYIVHDTTMATVFFGNLLTCAALVAIVTWKKRSPSIAKAQDDPRVHGQ